MREPKILFFDTKPYDRQFFDEANGEYGFRIKYLNNRLSADTVALAKGYDAVCAFVNDTVDKPVADELADAGIRLVALRCAGYNNVDLEAVYNRIHVVRVPAYSPHAVAEHALSLMMALNRKTHRAYYRTRDMNFAINGLLGFDMFEKTVGVVGTGKIGCVMAEILGGTGLKVRLYDPYPKQEWADEHGFRYVTLEEMYREADILTLHCPLTRDNVYMINRDSLATMKDGVMIINTGRGGLIRTADLIDGLKSGKVGAAGLDVYEEEDGKFFEDLSSEVIRDDVLARLITFPNVLITSHQAFFTREALTNISHTTLENIRLFFEEDKLPNEVCYRCSEDGCPKQKTGKCFN